MILKQFAPDDLDDEKLVSLIEEYIELSHSMTAMTAQSTDWWQDDEDGTKQYVWEEMKVARTSMLTKFPFLVHVTPKAPKWDI